MARAHFVKKAQKDYPDHDIKKGESYYWWKFRYGGKRMSKSRPKPSQLTQSEYLSTMYDTEETVADAVSAFNDDGDFDGLADALESAAETVREAGEECDEKFNNMPEGLQGGDSGQLLEQRRDACESLADELENAASQIRDLAPDDGDDETGAKEGETDDKDDAKEAAKSEAIGHAEGISWDFE